MSICTDCKHHGDVVICKECHDGDKYEKTKCSECAYWNNGGHDDHCTNCWGENFVPSQNAKFVQNQEAKADAGKLDLTLVPTAIIEEIAKVRSFGVMKYSDPENWKKVSIDRYWKATLRHILAAWNDMTSVDEESGLLHIAHASCNLAFIFALMRGENDAEKNMSREEYDIDALSEAFKRWRGRRKLTQAEVAKMCGVDTKSVGLFERSVVSLQTALAITECAKINLDDFKIKKTREDDSLFDFATLRQDLKDYLSEKGMSQRAFANAYGIPNQTLNNFLTSFHTSLREETIRRLCGVIGQPYECYVKSTTDKTFRWLEGRNLWQYRFMLNGIKRTVYGKTKDECKELAQKAMNEALRKISNDKVSVNKCPDGQCRIDITEVYKVVNEVVKDCLEKTFEQFLEKHMGEYKRRKRWI